jgi:hypothetical protein
VAVALQVELAKQAVRAVVLVVVLILAVLEQQTKVTQAVMPTTQQQQLQLQVAAVVQARLAVMLYSLAELLELPVRAVRAFQIL